MAPLDGHNSRHNYVPPDQLEAHYKHDIGQRFDSFDKTMETFVARFFGGETKIPMNLAAYVNDTMENRVAKQEIEEWEAVQYM